MSDPTLRKQSLATDASWLTLAKTLAFGVTIIVPLVMVRHLSQQDFGVYRQLSLLISTAIIVLPFGFAMSAFYFLPRAVDRRNTVALNILVVYTTISAIASGALLVRPDALAAIFHDPSLVPYGRLVAGIVFFTVASSFVDMLALANGDLKSATTFVVLSNLSKAALLSGAAIFFASVRAILFASMMYGLFQVVLLFAYLRHGFGSFLGRVDAKLLRQQVGYALPLGLAAWLYWLQTEAHHYFVARTFGAATYAIYAIGCVALPLTSIFGESMAYVVIRHVSELHSQNRRQEVVVLLSQAVRNLAAFYLPLYALLLLIGRDLIAVVYTPRFIGSWPIFAINLTLMPLSIVAIVNDAVIRSYSRCRPFLVVVRLALVPVLLATLWYVTPRYGPIATISTVVAANALERLIVAGRTAKVLELRWRDAALLKGVIGIMGTVLLAGVATVIARITSVQTQHWKALALSVVVFATVYVAANVVRIVAIGEQAIAEWPFTILPDSARQFLADLLARTRRTGDPQEVGEKAA